jgi:hypothetical protein
MFTGFIIKQKSFTVLFLLEDVCTWWKCCSLARSLVKETANRWLPQEAILMEILPAKWKV